MNKIIKILCEDIEDKDFDELYHQLSLKVSSYGSTICVENNRISDIKDMWNNEELIKEGDIVLLHNWGWDNSDQIIGVAKVVYDTEYHAWSFEMIAGNYIESSYDRWRQSPRVIGSVSEGITDKEFKDYSIDDVEEWKELINVEKAIKNLEALFK